MAIEAKRQVEAGVAETRDPDEFAAILKQSFKPRSDRVSSGKTNAYLVTVKQAKAP